MLNIALFGNLMILDTLHSQFGAYATRSDIQGWVGCGIAPSGGTGVVSCLSTELENLENEFESSPSGGDEGELDDAMGGGGNESKIHDECDPCLKKSEDRYGDSA